MNTKLDDFTQALTTILKSTNLGLDELNIKVPKGFWKKVSESLNSQRIETERSMKWSLGNCSAFFQRHKKDVLDLLNSADSNRTQIQEKSPRTCGPKTIQNQPEKITSPDDMLLSDGSLTHGSLSGCVTDEIKELVRKEVTKLLSTRTIPIGSDSKGKYPIAPPAPRVGKKLLGKRVKLGVMVDEVLNQLVVKAARELNQTCGQIVGNALWVYFGEPLLSFQKNMDLDERE